VTLLAVVLAYLLGSFPSGVVVSRLMLGRDIRDIGSGNIGAANAARAGGIKAGAAVGLLDVLKGLVAVLVGRLLGLDQTGLALTACAAVLGHDFSLFLRLHGGKGVATTFGAMLAVSPAGTLPAAVIWVAVLLTTGYSSLASLLALLALPIALALTGAAPTAVVAACFLLVLGVVKHRDNISRLLSGTESSFKRRPTDGA
jgi:acyl phosphate:glycerol-3-phosphate acyltransferase